MKRYANGREINRPTRKLPTAADINEANRKAYEKKRRAAEERRAAGAEEQMVDEAVGFAALYATIARQAIAARQGRAGAGKYAELRKKALEHYLSRQWLSKKDAVLAISQGNVVAASYKSVLRWSRDWPPQ